jgi:Icc-related predicted phosphoesterase
MKITFLSDTHTYHNEVVVEPCDIFCFTGDATNIGEVKDFVDFFEWLRKIPAKRIVWIAGNHDKALDKHLMLNTLVDPITKLLRQQQYNDVQSLLKALPKHIHYLNNSGVTINGINFWGSPVSPIFGVDWAFNKIRGDNINSIWAKIPKNTNILLTHTPPFGILDYVPNRQKTYTNEPNNVGCKDLLNRIKYFLPKLKICTFGHIHSNYGIKKELVSNTRHVTFINGCMLDNRYNFITKQPITVDYNLI